MMKAGSVGRRSFCDYDYYDGGESQPEVMNGDDAWDDKGHSMISHIYVSFDEVIMSIQFGYLENEALVLSERYGAYTDGCNFRAVRLKEDEYITGLIGVLVKNNGGIRSLTFHTNLGEYFIGSSSEKHPSDSKVVIDPAIRDRREFGGFFGSSCAYHLTSIGMYLSPITKVDQALLPTKKVDQATSSSSVQQY